MCFFKCADEAKEQKTDLRIFDILIISEGRGLHSPEKNKDQPILDFVMCPSFRTRHVRHPLTSVAQVQALGIICVHGKP